MPAPTLKIDSLYDKYQFETQDTLTALRMALMAPFSSRET